jgi:hypothetical protein
MKRITVSVSHVLQSKLASSTIGRIFTDPSSGFYDGSARIGKNTTRTLYAWSVAEL